MNNEELNNKEINVENNSNVGQPTGIQNGQVYQTSVENVHYQTQTPNVSAQYPSPPEIQPTEETPTTGLNTPSEVQYQSPNINVEVPNVNINVSTPSTPEQNNTTPQTVSISNTTATSPNTVQPGAVKVEPVVEQASVVEEVPSKQGKAKTILLILFFIFLLAFIMFLPNISEFIKNGSFGQTSDTRLNNGVLTCSMDKNDDTTDISYTTTFNFTNREILTSSINITTESENANTVSTKYSECNALSNIANTINGLDVTCTTSDNINTTIETYNLKLIDLNNLTPFTERGGTYPEHKYGDNVYDVEQTMIKAGYDCETKAS